MAEYWDSLRDSGWTAGVLCAWLVVLLLLPEAVGAASTGGGDLEIIDLTGGSARDRAVRKLVRMLPRRGVVLPPDDTLLDACRWVSEEDTLACADLKEVLLERIARGRWVVAPLGRTVLFETLVLQAEEQLAFLDLDGALETAAWVREWLPCEQSLLSHEDIVRFFLVTALAHLYRGDDEAVDAFLQLLVVEPGFRLPGEVRTREAQTALAKARARVEALERVRVVVADGGGEVVWDGRARTELYPGKHVAQLKAAHGEVRTRWVVVEDPGGGRFEVDFGLPSREEARARLARRVGRGDLGEPTAALLAWYMGRRGQRELFFLARDAWTGELGLWRFSREGGLQPVEEVVEKGLPGTELTPGGEAGQRTASSWRIGLEAGAVALLGGGVAFLAADREAGFSLGVARLGPPVTIELRGGWRPYRIAAGASSSSCPPAPGTAEATDIAAVVACLESRAVAELGLGVGRALAESARIRFEPALFLDLARVPNVVVADPSGGPVLVGDAVMGGASLRFRCTFAVFRRPGSPEVGVDVSVGGLWTTAQDLNLVATTVGLAAVVDVPF